MKSIGTIVLLLFLAAVASECIYLFVLMPQFSDYTPNAPVIWWILILSPFGLASFLVGWFSNGVGSIVIYSLFASVTGILGRLVFLRAIGTPSDHDILWANLLKPSDLQSAVPSFLLFWLIIAITMSSSWALRVFLQKKKLRTV
jgi:hypothetical protein